MIYYPKIVLKPPNTIFASGANFRDYFLNARTFYHILLIHDIFMNLQIRELCLNSSLFLNILLITMFSKYFTRERI